MSAITHFVKSLEGKPVLVYGLGKSGVSAVRVLRKAGAHVVVGDDNPESFKALSRMKVEILDDVSYAYTDYAFLLLSPGIPLTHPEPHDVVKRAREADLDIIGDLELFYRIYPDVKTIGVTGTNGKSTTTTLIEHILKSGGYDAVLGGNIGTPVFDLDPPKESTWLVLEMSSFQIDLCPTLRPDISVVLNLTPDHLDRHGSMENYRDVKERLTELCPRSDYNVTVICTDDPHTQKIFSRAKDLDLRKIIETSTIKSLGFGVYEADDMVYDNLGQEREEIGDLSKIPTLKGIHNYQNAISAYAVARAVGLRSEVIWAAMQKFPGLNHRQYLVRTINGVSYVNDSKSTNAASAAVALGCRNNIYWIVGGRKKKNGLEGLEEFFPRIKHCYLIGEATESFADWFDKYGVDYTRCYTLEKALDAAHKTAQDNRGQPGGAGVVLLSPACASFDQFSSFEDRGDHFAKLVNALEE